MDIATLIQQLLGSIFGGMGASGGSGNVSDGESPSQRAARFNETGTASEYEWPVGTVSMDMLNSDFNPRYIGGKPPWYKGEGMLPLKSQADEYAKNMSYLKQVQDMDRSIMQGGPSKYQRPLVEWQLEQPEGRNKSRLYQMMGSGSSPY